MNRTIRLEKLMKQYLELSNILDNSVEDEEKVFQEMKKIKSDIECITFGIELSRVEERLSSVSVPDILIN